MTSILKKEVVQFIRYFLFSAIALVIDYSTYWLLFTNNIFSQPNAATLGYLIGLFISYLFMTNFVFSNGWLRKKVFLQGLLFLLTGFIGAGLTYVCVLLFSFEQFESIHLGKIIAVGVSFVVVFLLRKYGVFKISQIH